MDLKNDKRQNIQLALDFSPSPAGEAREAGREETESFLVTRDNESPAQTNRWMEEVCERDNLKEALRRVKANKGSAGIDRMTVDQLDDYLKEHWLVIREQLLNGTYEPKPVRRVEIPKPDGGMRKLGIPTVLDRLIQQAVMQVLQRRWDRTFSEGSYGFRPGRSAHQAVAQAQNYVAEGHGWCVDLDLEKIFRPGQSRQTDGSDCETRWRQTATETHSRVLERGRDGERPGQSERGRNSARRSTFTTAQQYCAR
jgi:RNA-directed DNA polymerase